MVTVAHIILLPNATDFTEFEICIHYRVIWVKIVL